MSLASVGLSGCFVRSSSNSGSEQAAGPGVDQLNRPQHGDLVLYDHVQR